MTVNVSKSGGIYIEISGDISKLREGLADAQRLAKMSGQSISESLLDALTPKDAARISGNISRYFQGAAKAAKAASADLSQYEDHFKNMGRSIGVAEKDLQKFAKMNEQAFKANTQKQFLDYLKGIQRLTGQTDAEMNRLAKSLGGVGNEFTRAGRSATTFGACLEDTIKKYAGMVIGVQALRNASSAILDSALQMDRLNKSYTTIYDSAGAAKAQLDYLYVLSNELGLQFQSTAESAKTFFAAGKGSTLEGDLNSIFKSVSSAGAALSLSESEMQGVFLALGQMISKGKVQTQELRGQLGERLPGAFLIAAKAMGVTTAELDKLLSEGKIATDQFLPKFAAEIEKAFGSKAVAAGQGLQGQLNRLSTEWGRFKESFADADFLSGSMRNAAEGVKFLTDNSKELVSVGKSTAAAFVAWQVTLRGLIPLFAALKYEWQFFTMARTEVGALNAATASLGSTVTKVRSGLAGLVSMAGGPFALGITAAAGAIAYLATQENAATAFAREHADAMQMVSNNADTARQAIDAYAKKLREMNEAQRDFELARIARERADITSAGAAYRTIVNDITPLAVFDSKASEIRQKLSDAAQLVLPSNIMAASVRDLETLRDRVTDIATEYGRTKEAADALETINSLIVLAKQADVATQSVSNIAGSIQQVANALNTLDPTKMAKGIKDLEDKVAQAKRTAVGQASATALISIGVDSSDIDKFGNVSQEAFAKYDEATQASIRKTQDMARELYGLNAAARTSASSITKEIELIRDRISRLALTEEDYREESLGKKIAEYERAGASAAQIQKLTAALRELYAAEDARKANDDLKRQAEEDKRIVEQFYKELQSGAVLGYIDWLKVQNDAIEKRRENFKNAGVELQDIERWVAQERLKIARESAVEIEAAYRMANLEAGEGSFEDGLFASLARITEGYTNVATELTETFGNFFQSFTQGFADSIGRAVVESENLGEALHNVAKSAISSLISALVQLGIQYVVNAALGQSVAAATMAASTAMGVTNASTLAAAYAPAAAAASLASFGGNAAPAMTGIAATYGLTQMLSMPIGFKEGGYTGNVGRDQVAGVVHGGEYVFNADAVRRIGVSQLEAMSSGSVGSISSSGKSASAAFGGVSGSLSVAPVLNVSIENYGSAKEFEVEQLSENEVRIICRDEIKKQTPGLVATQMNQPNSVIAKSVSRNLKSERRR